MQERWVVRCDNADTPVCDRYVVQMGGVVRWERDAGAENTFHWRSRRGWYGPRRWHLSDQIWENDRKAPGRG